MWEYAARGGLIGKRYSWGDDESVARDCANYKGTGGKDQWHQSTAPVGSFAANGYSLYDMAGNVSEFCADWYDPDYYSKSPSRKSSATDMLCSGKSVLTSPSASALPSTFPSIYSTVSFLVCVAA